MTDPGPCTDIASSTQNPNCTVVCDLQCGCAPGKDADSFGVKTDFVGADSTCECTGKPLSLCCSAIERDKVGTYNPYIACYPTLGGGISPVENAGGNIPKIVFATSGGTHQPQCPSDAYTFGMSFGKGGQGQSICQSVYDVYKSYNPKPKPTPKSTPGCGAVSAWSEWSKCENGSQSRSRKVVGCPDEVATQECGRSSKSWVYITLTIIVSMGVIGYALYKKRKR